MTMKQYVQILGASPVAEALWAAQGSVGEPEPNILLDIGRARVPLLATGKPGGRFGYLGFDISWEQSVAARFSVPAVGDFHLDRIGLFLMNNSSLHRADVTLSVQSDALDEHGPISLPSGYFLERWRAPVQALGWEPTYQYFRSTRKPLLKAGRHYWVVAESVAQPGMDPVWVAAARGRLMWTTTSVGAWQAPHDSAALTLRVDATSATGH